MPRSITIADRSYAAFPWDRAGYDAHLGMLTAVAKRLDNPLKRFRDGLQGLSRAERAAAVGGFVQRPDWDAPPRELLERLACGTCAMAALAARYLEPRRSYAEWKVQFAALAEAQRIELYKQLLAALAPLTYEDVNRRLRAAVGAENARQQQGA